MTRPPPPENDPQSSNKLGIEPKSETSDNSTGLPKAEIEQDRLKHGGAPSDSGPTVPTPTCVQGGVKGTTCPPEDPSTIVKYQPLESSPKDS